MSVNHSIHAVMDEAEGRTNSVVGREAVSRREFLRVSGMAGGGVVLAFGLLAPAPAPAQAPPGPSGGGPPGGGPPGSPSPNAPLAFSAFVQIAPDGAIRILSARPDIGQGIKTSSAMTIAEELDADWSRVTVEQSPVNAAIYGSQNVGGSRSTPGSWDQLRRVGATGRALLISAAAQTWSVPESECTAAASVVIHAPSGRKLSYGELATRAAALPVPDVAHLKLKSRDAYRLLGKRIGSVDNPKIVTGQPLYGMDVQLPGMVYAAFARAPAIRATVRGGNFDEVKRLPGVRDVFVLEGKGADAAESLPGVVVIATSTWAAFSARRALEIDWDASKAGTDSWQGYVEQAAALSKQRGAQVVRESGDAAGALARAPKRVEAFYTYPFVSHATLEPQNTTAWYRDGAIEMWSPAQTIDRARPWVAEVLGLPLDKVTVHLPRIGGGFGRRLMYDYLTEAALIAKRVNGPVKLVWTREDDLQFDYYRVGGFHALQGAIDANGKLLAWQDHFITFSADGKSPVSGGNLDAAEFPTPVVSNVHVSQTLLPLATRCGPWRAPRSCALAFPMQSFIHELSAAAGRDHRDFLLELLAQLPTPAAGQPGLNPERAAAVVSLATEKAGWGRKLPSGRGLGLAFYYSHSGHFAEVAEVSVAADKKLTVHRVTVAGDIGLIVNALGTEQQIQGSVMDGLSTLLGQRITMEGGAVQQQNFNDYPLMRIASAPVVDVHMLVTDYSPTGVGEPALPPVAPAVCNAIFAATGVRVRELPLSLAGYRA